MTDQAKYFGPHHEAVADVIRFALQEFEWQHPPLAAETLVVESLDSTAFAQGYIDEVSRDPIDWLGFLEWQRGEYMTAKPEGINQEEYEAFGSLVIVELGKVDQYIEQKFTSILPQRIRDLTAGLFGDCALCRAAIGAKSTFWEGVFASLKTGGIPVGWSGHWPAGRMVVFYRPQ